MNRREGRAGRALRRLARRASAHLLLLCGSAIFLFPFLWMVGLSLKTDEEAASGRLFPSIPTFRGDSPFVLPAPDVERPADVGPARWRRLLPALLSRARQSAEGVSVPEAAASVNAGALRDAAAADVVGRIVARMDRATWARPDGQVLDLIATRFDDTETSGALDRCLGRLEFRGLLIRSLDGHVTRLCAGSEVARRWTVESGPGELVPAGPEAACLRYHFASAGDVPVVLRFDFDSPFGPDQLHRLIVALKGDDSWNRISATLDIGDARWESSLGYYVTQHRPASLVLQPPTFQDAMAGPKTWVPLAVSKASTFSVSSSASNRATLRLVLRPSSSLRAIYGKAQRNYLRAFRSVPFWTYVGNSLLLVTMQMAGSLFSAAFVAYAFARLRWPGRGVALGVLLSTMMLPAQVTMVPSFLIWRALGWYNTLTPLWAGSWFGSAFFIFLMTQHMKTIPIELDEAARIDGLSAPQAWWYVILPQVRPAMAAIAILTFMGAWNEFLGPLILLRDQDKFPLGLGLFAMRVDQGGDWTMVMAANVMMVLPVIVVFFLFQRYFIEGSVVTGMKG